MPTNIKLFGFPYVHVRAFVNYQYSNLSKPKTSYDNPLRRLFDLCLRSGKPSDPDLAPCLQIMTLSVWGVPMEMYVYF